MTALIKYDEAVRALAECVRVDEAKGLQDKAAGLLAYAKQAKDERLITYAREIQMRAQRRVGELLIQMKDRGERARYGKPPPGQSERSVRRQRAAEVTASKTGSSSDRPTLSDLGVSEDHAAKWQKLAKMPTKEFEEKVAVATGAKPRPNRAKPKATPAAKPKAARSKPKADKTDRSPVDEANGFNREATVFVTDFCPRLEQWVTEHPDLKPGARDMLARSLQMCSVELQRLAQLVDGR